MSPATASGPAVLAPPRDLRTLADALRVDREGVLPLGGVRTVVVPIAVLQEFQGATARVMGRGAAAICYEVGESVGKRIAGMTARALGTSDPDRVLDQVLAGTAARGLGSVEVVHLDLPAAEGVLRHRDCPFVPADPRPRPTCTFVAGLWAGVSGTLAGRLVQAEEVLCAATGAPYCEFRLAPADPLGPHNG